MQSSQNLQVNLQQLDKFAEQLEPSVDGRQLIVLPECALFFGQGAQQQLKNADGMQQYPLRDKLAELARQKNSYMIAGSISVHAGNNKLYNRSYCFSPEGKVLAHYDKLHLFDANVNDGQGYQESKLFKAGDKIQVVDTNIGKLGLSICYDLRFPELYQHQRQRGAEILVVPAAFTENTGKAHWQTLLRARAIENQCFVVAAGQWGKHDNGRSTFGNTMVIDPWGEVLGCKQQGTGWLCIDIELSRLTEIRSNMPVFEHKRLSLQ